MITSMNGGPDIFLAISIRVFEFVPTKVIMVKASA